MQKVIKISLIFVLLVIFYQLYQLFSYHRELRFSASASDKKLQSFKQENFQLQADLEYFQEPENLVKELRSRFNYKKPGEKLIIVVPPKDIQ